MYLPCLGSHLAIIDCGSNAEFVISATDNCSWYAFSAEITAGAYEDNMYEFSGTAPSWFETPSRPHSMRRQIVSWRSTTKSLAPTICLSSCRSVFQCPKIFCKCQHGFVVQHHRHVGVFQQRCSALKTELYGSTTAVETCGDG